MIFVPITTSDHIKANVLILQSILFLGIGLYLILAQLFYNLSDPFGASLNYFLGGGSIVLGFLGVLLGRKFTPILIATNQIIVFASLLFLLYSTTDSSATSISILVAFIAFSLLNNIYFEWKIGLTISIALIALIAVRLFLVESGRLELEIAQNPLWLFNLNIIVILLSASILIGYFGYKMRLLTEQLEEEYHAGYTLIHAKKEQFDKTAEKIEEIDRIFQEKADEINSTVVENAEVLSPETTFTYEELLSVASKVAKSVDEVILTINTQIQKEEDRHE